MGKIVKARGRATATRVVTLTRRLNARRYQVAYSKAGEPIRVSIWAINGNPNSEYRWRTIWDFGEPLEGKARDAVIIATGAILEQEMSPA